uniref:E3 ubiquitin-protein ligase RGLG1 n=1 Tax=Phallusia mammillata TaxID=59560 RepID=A0A6F9DAP8_9ASCI|nr:E3 ubiquitin-protein ligase RGLG1 [Phallusia mammillata]
MSLLLFLFGSACLFYLYVNYNSKGNKDELKEASDNHQSSIRNKRPQLSSIFKAFIKTLIDPANNNYLEWGNGNPDPFVFRAFVDRFQSFDDITNAMREAGLEKCQLILGIDFTASNEWQGRTSNRGFSLHNVTSKVLHNPYQHIITVLGHTLKDFVTISQFHYNGNEQKKTMGIHAYGFGDSITKDQSTFPLQKNHEPCVDFHEVLTSYRECASRVVLGGPTSYAPVIYKAIDIVEKTKQFHLLVIIADGQFVNEEPTAKAIVAASFYPLSIVVVGVGDGPWSILHQFDDWLPQRHFDNFQFVEYADIVKESHGKNAEAALALQILMEVPDQYKMVQKLGFISQKLNGGKTLSNTTEL